ncbi:hypothetical protein J2Z44_003925 [Clostridium punense]|uniref:Uncharacterized protein n=1 Tax=Clostridium punense TaxID=1054297 RepID=A0ABS4K9P4_9CLOT|nr:MULTISPECIES: hypothetical protein [Clostridium]EQB88907.1 hypothetical protein M918_22700 [Clostridium sp. BL8]MBP2024075.1 hypothetical protein [Clostridium punense]
MSDKFNLNYVTKINNYIKKLEGNKANLEKEIKNHTTYINLKEEKLNKLSFEKRTLDEKYEQFLNFLINRGISFEVNNNTFKLRQWDSINVVSVKNNIILRDKNNQVVKVIEDMGWTIFKDIINRGYSIKAIVIRAGDKIAVIQVRFNSV